MADNSNIRVLVVDDSGTIRKTAETILKKEGYTVASAEDGFAAFSQIIEFKPSIIFLDIMMPRLDGYQVCSVIKSNPDFQNIPVLMLSSKDSIFDKARGKIVGANHFMTKPFSRDELLGAIANYIK